MGTLLTDYFDKCTSEERLSLCAIGVHFKQREERKVGIARISSGGRKELGCGAEVSEKALAVAWLGKDSGE